MSLCGGHLFKIKQYWADHDCTKQTATSAVSGIAAQAEQLTATASFNLNGGDASICPPDCAQEFAAAVKAVTVALGGTPATPGSNSSGSGALSSSSGASSRSGNGTLSGSGGAGGGNPNSVNVRPSASGRRPVLPVGAPTR